jgi:hypothetical protein
VGVEPNATPVSWLRCFHGIDTVTVTAIADKAHRRLMGRYRRMTARGKEHNKVVVAIARELVGHWPLE